MAMSAYGKNIVRVITVVVCLLIAVYAYNRIDGTGWIPHSGNAYVKFPQGGWDFGEYEACAAIKSPKAEANLDCSGGLGGAEAIHEMHVTFYGKTAEKPRIFRCQRSANSIICHLPLPEKRRSPTGATTPD